jgi:hypothetical protein
MKFSILFFSFVLISHEILAFSVCPADVPKKLATAPKTQVLYQVVRTKKDDIAKCYKLDIINVASTVQISQSMLIDGVPLEHKYVASASFNGTWDVKMNSKLEF